MTASAWWFMAIVWGVVIVNTLYCFWKLLTSRRDFDSGE
jgi:heme/copper-type cytochrome/quinol oxidase subunit 2